MTQTSATLTSAVRKCCDDYCCARLVITQYEIMYANWHSEYNNSPLVSSKCLGMQNITNDGDLEIKHCR